MTLKILQDGGEIFEVLKNREVPMQFALDMIMIGLKEIFNKHKR